MKTLTYGAAVLLLLAAGLWAFAMGDALPPRAGSGAAAVSAPQHGEWSPHPGSDSLVARRVLAEADGLYTPSPDGTLLAFSDHDGNAAIRELRTGDVRVLTEDGRLQEGGPFVYGLRFSPDQTELAILWVGPSEEVYVEVVDVETKEIRELFPEKETHLWIDIGAWSPDGEVIAAVLYFEDGSQRIALMPADGGEPTVVRSFDWRAPGGLAFSPDGRWLAYHVPRGQDSPIHDIHLLARDGSTEVPLRTGPTNHRVAGWMPGGGPFFYLEGDRARSSLLAARLEEGRIVDEPRVVRADLRDPWVRGFSDDALFYVQMPERRQAYTVPWNPEAGEFAGPLSPLDPGRTMDWPLNMAWSPEGDRVAYVARADGDESTLVIRSLATGAERTMPVPFNEQFTRIEWSPVEERIAVGGTDNRLRAGVHLVELSDGATELFLRTDRERLRYTHPRWSPDGDALYVTRRNVRESSESVLRVDLAEGVEEVIFDGFFDGSALYPVEAIAVSPDERLLAVAYGAGREAWGEEGSSLFRVLLVPLDDDQGEIREMLRLERPEDRRGFGSAGLDWTPGGEQLIVGTPWRDLWAADRNGTEAWKVAQDVGTRPRIHPNGRELALIAGENRWEVWALENLGAIRTADEETDRRPP